MTSKGLATQAAAGLVNQERRRLQPEDEVVHQKALERIAHSRDRAAFALLFDHFAPRLKTFMLRKGTNSQLAEDLVQEAMLAVWRKAGLYDGSRGSVSAWIFTIARNLRIDALRRETVMPYTVLEDIDLPSDELAADEALGNRQEESAVAGALADIPQEQKELLLLSYVEGMPQAEIARRLSLPLGTVKSRMRLAYIRLRRSLEDLK